MSYPAKLSWNDGEAKGIALPDSPFLVGRSKECHLVLTGNGSASRKHAEIRREGARWMLTDLGSGNGTTVNGQRVMETALQDGDTISIAGVDIRFSCPSLPRVAANPVPAPASARAPGPGAPPPASALPAGFVPQVPPPSYTTPPPAPPRRAEEIPGTEAIDMGQVMKKLTEETAALDAPPSFSAEEGDPEAADEKKKTLLLAGVGGGLVLLLLVVLALLPGTPTQTGPVFERYAKLSINVNDVAYLTLDHSQLRPRDPSMIKAVPKSETRNEIVVTALKPGKTFLEVLSIDPSRGWEVEVEITEKEPWPAGWTDDDRLSAAEELKKQADSGYRTIHGHMEALVRVYYGYVKVLRLYENCAYFPPEPQRQALERKLELELKIKEKEAELLREYHRLKNLKQTEEALNFLTELLILFPEDGAGSNLLTKHGDNRKYHQYFLLREKLLEARRRGS